ncbi:MAG: SH3 domain-containing protein, partial [Chloroflexota bacterium]
LDPLGEAPLGDLATAPVLASHHEVDGAACGAGALAAALPEARRLARLILDGGAPGGSLFAPGDPGATTAEGVRLREGPGLAFAALATVAEAEHLVVQRGPETADGLAWYAVQGPTLAGWMAAEYLAAAGPGDAGLAIGGMTGDLPGDGAPVAAGAAGADTMAGAGGAAAAPGGSNPATDAGRPPKPGPGGSARFATGAAAEVAEAELNLRDAPGGAVLAVLPPGARVTIAGAPAAHDGGAWFPVETADGLAGWVSAAYLRPR